MESPCLAQSRYATNSDCWSSKVFLDAQLDFLVILEGVTIYCCVDSCTCSVHAWAPMCMCMTPFILLKR